jgi:hypothetical protein
MILNNFLDKNGKFIIPKHIKNIRFDIGLSYCAPNSTIWLNDSNDTFVIGIEANKYACDRIISGGFIAHQKNLSFPYPHENFLLINVALDDVKEMTNKPFYHMSSDVGVSSLLKPTESLGHTLQEISDVTVIPFSFILEKIDWDRFNYIEMVKIDTQGKDLDIIKSSGKFLDKIVYLNCEINTFDHYENNNRPNEFNDFLIKNGFEFVLDNSFVNGEVVDRTYINNKFIDLKDKINYFVL